MPDNRISRIDCLWQRVSLVVWLIATCLFLLPWYCREGGGLGVFLGMLTACLTWGGIVMLYFVGIPLRVAMNLIFKERRRQRLRETMICVLTFLVMSVLAYMTIWLYPPSSMGY